MLFMKTIKIYEKRLKFNGRLQSVSAEIASFLMIQKKDEKHVKTRKNHKNHQIFTIQKYKLA